MTRASTPGWLSTRTESVWRSVAGFFINMTSHHHLAFLGDCGLEVLRGVAEQHFIMRPAGRDHREAVLGRIDHAVADHRAIDREHFSYRCIHLLPFSAPHSHPLIGSRHLDEVR